MPASRAQVGRRAPSIELPSTRGDLRLDDFDGRWLLLFFYPRDFSLLCPMELVQLHERHAELDAAGLSVVGISTDDVETHQRWISAPVAAGGLGGALAFPLAADVDGEVCRAYGVLSEPHAVALRGTFLVDPNGVLAFSSIHTLSVGRSVDDMLRVASALRSGGMCVPGWQPGQATLDLASTLRPGTILDEQFRIEEELGAGGMGRVFRARDLRLRRTVALKVLARADDQEQAERETRFLREAQAVAALSHPNICAIHQVHDGATGRYLVLEFVDGQDLTLLAPELDPSALLDIGAAIAGALEAVHAAALVHRDVKPANIRITSEGRAVLLDFGLARRGAAVAQDTATIPITQPGMLIGTLQYMSPEQVDGDEVGPPSDVFSLGTTLYETLTGTSPFQGSTPAQTISRIGSEVPGVDSLRADLPVEAAVLIRRMMQREPLARPSASEVHARLVDLLR